MPWPWAWNVSPEKYQATREGKLEPSVQDSGRPLVVGSHSNERCDNGASDRFYGQEISSLRSAVAVTTTSVYITSVAGGLGPLCGLCPANPYISLAVGLHNLFLLST